MNNKICSVCGKFKSNNKNLFNKNTLKEHVKKCHPHDYIRIYDRGNYIGFKTEIEITDSVSIWVP